MNTDKKISRRDALKRMGAAVVCSAVASSGLLSFASCEAKGSDGSFPTGTEKNPNARYRNEHVSLMDIKRANSQF